MRRVYFNKQSILDKIQTHDALLVIVARFDGTKKTWVCEIGSEQQENENTLSFIKKDNGGVR